MQDFDLGINDLDHISFNLNDNDFSKPSVNFGPGIELLMNDKKRSSSNNVNVDLGELDKLEDELNDLSGISSGGGNKTLSGFATNFFGDNNSKAIHFNDNTQPSDSGLGQATAKSVSGVSKTFDGFSKMNDVPLEAPSTRMTDRDKRRKKKMMIQKLEEWYDKGIIKNTSHFNSDSNYEEIEDEYESALENKRSKDSIKLQGWWFMTFVNSIEYANAVFNPFDLNLDGWGEQVNEDLESYDDIFTELYTKYKGGKLSPEISLLLRIGFSAAMVNFTNKALSTATPGFNDVIKQSPELMKMFTNATVQSMAQQHPAGAFMNSMMNNREPDINTSFGPPPPPIQTNVQGQKSSAQPTQMQFTQRPDIMAGRGGPMFREQGVDMNPQNNFQQQSPQISRPHTPQQHTQQPQISRPPAPQQQHPQQHPQQQPQQPQYQQPQQPQYQQHPPQQPPLQQYPQPQRQEMKGPQNSDINHILSSLKTREIPSPPQEIQQNSISSMDNFFSGASIIDENDSIISISSLREMQSGTRPKKHKRKQRSDKNTISLDI